ncbi:hypothetical protein [Actinospica robiniae]|uniref:hypothetical protein n=1 Tax=Actinospica robiniae TaxID=304901 RepID=UPI000425401B|nr:hypothetical protein [Actinospica robiniae]
MTGSVRPRTASLLVGAAGALALTAALGGCASSETTPTGSGVGTVAVTVNSPSAASSAPSAPASPTSASSAPASVASPSAHAPTTTSAGGGGSMATPKQVLSAAPAGAKLVSFDDATASSDGRTLYVELESMGGACGQYDVVLQQSASAVKVGLVHLSSGGHVCPQFVGPMRIAVALAAPLSGRPVVDLSDGQSLKVG